MIYLPGPGTTMELVLRRTLVPPVRYAAIRNYF